MRTYALTIGNHRLTYESVAPSVSVVVWATKTVRTTIFRIRGRTMMATKKVAPKKMKLGDCDIRRRFGLGD